MCEFDLKQINVEPTRLSKILGIAIVSPRFTQCKIRQENPIAGSEHTSQRLVVTVDVCHTNVDNVIAKVDIILLINFLSIVNRDVLFTGCVTVDEFVNRFHEVLQDSLSNATHMSTTHSPESAKAYTTINSC
jgi:hypothetical protein